MRTTLEILLLNGYKGFGLVHVDDFYFKNMTKGKKNIHIKSAL